MNGYQKLGVVVVSGALGFSAFISNPLFIVLY